MRKAETMQQWRTMAEKQSMLRHMTPIQYKARGSRYGACGIRIDGNPEFVSAVLSNLKELLAGENHTTRLELSRNIVDGSGIGKALDNTDTNAECCYIRLHMRGNEGQMASRIFDRHLDQAQAEYETA